MNWENQKTCIICGKPAEERHHIIPKRLRWKRSKTVWLCSYCHRAVHNRNVFDVKRLIELRCFASLHEYNELKDFAKYFFSLTEIDEDMEKVKKKVLECVDEMVDKVSKTKHDAYAKSLVITYLSSLKDRLENMFFGFKKKFEGKYEVIQ